MEFKDRLKELRESKRLTQAELAYELKKLKYNEVEIGKIYTQTISYWENGREPKYGILLILSNFFKVSVDYLLGKTDYISEAEYRLDLRTAYITKERIEDVFKLLPDIPDNSRKDYYAIVLNYLDQVPLGSDTDSDASNDDVDEISRKYYEYNTYAYLYKFILFSKAGRALDELSYGFANVQLDLQRNDQHILSKEDLAIKYNECKVIIEKDLQIITNKLFEYQLYCSSSNISNQYYQYKEDGTEPHFDIIDFDRMKNLFLKELENYFDHESMKDIFLKKASAENIQEHYDI